MTTTASPPPTPKPSRKRAVPYVPSPAYLGENLAPEVSLCLDFCIEAIEAGWDIWPEHPNRRFDMVLVAREGCTTLMADGTPVPPGTQVGVHAKVALNHSVVAQLKREARRAKSWGIGPSYIVGLVPCAPRTPMEKKLAETLLGISKHGVVGLFYMFEQFNGHEHDETKRAANLKDTSKFGDVFEAGRRFSPPLLPTFWAVPGSSTTSTATEWKMGAIKFVQYALTVGPMDYEEIRVLLKKFKAGDLTTWKNMNWLIPNGSRVGSTGRKRTLYSPNPDSLSRPDLKHADVAEAMKQHEQAQAESR